MPFLERAGRGWNVKTKSPASFLHLTRSFKLSFFFCQIQKLNVELLLFISVIILRAGSLSFQISGETISVGAINDRVIVSSLVGVLPVQMISFM